MTYTRNHAEPRIIGLPRDAFLALAVGAIIVIGTVSMLFLALSAHGHAPAVPGPVPVTVQPAPVGETHGPQISA